MLLLMLLLHTAAAAAKAVAVATAAKAVAVPTAAVAVATAAAERNHHPTCRETKRDRRNPCSCSVWATKPIQLFRDNKTPSHLRAACREINGGCSYLGAKVSPLTYKAPPS